MISFLRSQAGADDVTEPYILHRCAASRFLSISGLSSGVPQPALSDPEFAKGESNGCPLW